MEKNLKNNIYFIYIYISDHFAVHLKLTHCKLTILQLKMV